MTNRLLRKRTVWRSCYGRTYRSYVCCSCELYRFVVFHLSDHAGLSPAESHAVATAVVRRVWALARSTAMWLFQPACAKICTRTLCTLPTESYLGVPW